MIREWFIKVNGYLFINKNWYLYEGNRTSSIIIIELRNTKSNTLIYAPTPTAYIASAFLIDLFLASKLLIVISIVYPFTTLFSSYQILRCYFT